MEKQVEKVFVKINQVWQKGTAVSEDGQVFKVKTNDNLSFEIEKGNKYLEFQKFPAQQFAVGDAKERLEGAYVSFDKLPENIQDAIIQGREYLHSSSYINDGKMRESVKMVQMLYSPTSGSKLDVQIKRNEPVKLEQAKAYNHQFTQAEFDTMVKDGQTISFMGSSTNGETFTKLAYYEPKLNDIRTKSALTANTYFYGQKLTPQQADAINKGLEPEITIDTKKGKKTYLVSYSPRAEKFITKSVEQSKMNKMEVKSAITVGEKKRKRVSQGVSL
ncbi:hypothetical protein [Ulvibacterium marinum]|uniref:DUF3945 domain-containing protein n=1 Tax=Ulvibacterium marinum TaxID=2419782 RepID=A0A3B0CGL2_9FLAO|nr:hypothetical protein [Ulvibacterium marinum]RKN83509.1 hypothetical protein D7Z94_06740 [Ulvibacterium marinum]